MSELPDWNDLSLNAHAAAEMLGHASPHLSPKVAELIAYRLDDEGGSYKAYCSPADLKRYAAGLLEIADWLEARVPKEEPRP